ncbi:MAG TPA: biotin--[acetyl-CoA-carboxylase] ligase [Pseudogracilibacillus sp.]|nr:biotin--[acetyl-CoA-carboxylase] ligase [Pseudogracilibacillus sp.]
MSSTRQKLIDLLSDAGTNYISGQYLSDTLNISRSAVWKHMNVLKEDGYEIEAKAKKGYRILQFPNKVSENTISWGLGTKWLGKKIIHKTSMPSTQALAHDLARNGAKHGTVIIADEQTTGKGRMGRTWFSKKGKAISMSMILRPNLLPYLTPQLTLLTATVVAEVLQQHTGSTVQIKWPNDILINGQKMTGILTEMQAEQDQVQYVIIGVGININHTAKDLPDLSEYQATSLYMATQQKWDIIPIIQQILRTFEEKYAMFLKDGFNPVKQSWESYGFRMNETLQITSGKETFNAVFLGIAEDGALLAKRLNGNIESIYSGEITWH